MDESGNSPDSVARLAGEDIYRRLFDAMAQGAFYRRADGKIEDINDAALQLLGTSREDFFSGQNSITQWKAIDETGRLILQEESPASIAFRSGQPVLNRLIGMFHPQRKEYVWIMHHAIPLIRPGETKPWMVLVTLVDVTQQYLTEKNFRIRQKQTEILADLGQLALSCGNIDDLMDSAVAWVSDTLGVKFCKVLELMPDGQSLLLRAGVGWRPGLVGVATVPADQNSQAGFTLISDKPVVVDDLASETRFSGPDLLVQHQVVSGISVIIGDHLRPFGVLGAHTNQRRAFTQDDVLFLLAVSNILASAVERAKNQLQIRQSEEKYRQLVNQAADAMYLADLSGRIIDVNEAACNSLGYSREELLARSVAEIDASLSHEQVVQILHEIQPGEVYTIETLHRRKDLSTVPIELRLSVMDLGNEERKALGLARDITERKQAEQALQLEREMLAQRVEDRTADLRIANAELAKAAKLKDEFLASMSHELRTPLTGILGLSEALQKQVYGPLNERQSSCLRDIEESGNHLLALINDILDLSKIEAGKAELSFQPVLLDDVCQASLRLVRQAVQKKKLHVSYEMDSSLNSILADERRIKQILVNLLSNAIKFTPDGGKIGLELHHKSGDPSIQFVVWDSGIGIDSKDYSRLFKPFIQIDAGLNRQYSGTGLGLSLVLRLAELHGGSVSMESEPMQGSRFTVEIPVLTPQENPAELRDQIVHLGNVHLSKAHLGLVQAATLESQLAPDDRPVSVLVVDDNELSVQTFREYLAHQGFKVSIARNGIEAVSEARRLVPDLILMDIQMPVLDGLEATRRIRQESSIQHIPIIALTALAMPGDEARCMEAGVNGYLSKPVRLEVLSQTIREVLHR